MYVSILHLFTSVTFFIQIDQMYDNHHHHKSTAMKRGSRHLVRFFIYSYFTLLIMIFYIQIDYVYYNYYHHCRHNRTTNGTAVTTYERLANCSWNGSHIEVQGCNGTPDLDNSTHPLASTPTSQTSASLSQLIGLFMLRKMTSR